MTISLLFLWNIAGDIAFAVGGALAAQKLKLGWFATFLSAMSTTFFGGAFLRDLLTLHTPPGILSSPIEIAWVAALSLGLSLILTYTKRKLPSKLGKAFKHSILVCDSLGVLAFGAIGYMKGRGMLVGVGVCLLCGWFTACGGGIIAAFIRSAAKRGTLTEKAKCLASTLFNNRHYFVFGGIVTVTYAVTIAAGASETIALAILTPLAVFLGFITDRKM